MPARMSATAAACHARVRSSDHFRPVRGERSDSVDRWSWRHRGGAMRRRRTTPAAAIAGHGWPASAGDAGRPGVEAGRQASYAHGSPRPDARRTPPPPRRGAPRRLPSDCAAWRTHRIAQHECGAFDQIVEAGGHGSCMRRHGADAMRVRRASPIGWSGRACGSATAMHRTGPRFVRSEADLSLRTGPSEAKIHAYLLVGVAGFMLILCVALVSWPGVVERKCDAHVVPICRQRTGSEPATVGGNNWPVWTTWLPGLCEAAVPA